MDTLLGAKILREKLKLSGSNLLETLRLRHGLAIYSLLPVNGGSMPISRRS